MNKDMCACLLEEDLRLLNKITEDLKIVTEAIRRDLQHEQFEQKIKAELELGFKK